MTEVVNTPNTLLNFYQTTWRTIPEDSHLHADHHENLESQQLFYFTFDHMSVDTMLNSNLFPLPLVAVVAACLQLGPKHLHFK
jgi:hypothetical protein